MISFLCSVVFYSTAILHVIQSVQWKEIYIRYINIFFKKICIKKKWMGEKNPYPCEYIYIFFIIDRKSVYPGSILLSASGNKKIRIKKASLQLQIPDRYPTSHFILVLDLMKEFSSSNILFASLCRLCYKWALDL